VRLTGMAPETVAGLGTTAVITLDDDALVVCQTFAGCLVPAEMSSMWLTAITTVVSVGGKSARVKAL
jgi:hypothetical protein